MMRLAYLAANAAYAFTFGTELICLEGWPLFFSTRREALEAAHERGLAVSRSNVVSAA